MENEPIKILGGNIKLDLLEDVSYRWRNIDEKNILLEFAEAFEIKPETWGEGITNCKYQIYDRKFNNLNFSNGDEIKIFAENKFSGYKLSLMQRSGGEKKFLYQCENIPTFDSDDREWDGFKKCVIYFDRGINLIHCRYGYKIPRIKIFLNLQQADNGQFLTWLKIIDCPSEILSKILLSR